MNAHETSTLTGRILAYTAIFLGSQLVIYHLSPVWIALTFCYLGSMLTLRETPSLMRLVALVMVTGDLFFLKYGRQLGIWPLVVFGLCFIASGIWTYLRELIHDSDTGTWS